MPRRLRIWPIVPGYSSLPPDMGRSCGYKASFADRGRERPLSLARSPSGDFNVRAREVVAEKKERMASEPSDGVAQAIAKIERGRMPSLAEAAECLQRFPPVLLAEDYRHYPKVAE